MILAADEHDLKRDQFHDTKERLDANKPTTIVSDQQSLQVRVDIIHSELEDILQLGQEPAREVIQVIERDGADAT